MSGPNRERNAVYFGQIKNISSCVDFTIQLVAHTQMENRHRLILMAPGCESDVCHWRKVGTVGQGGVHTADFTGMQDSVGIFPQFSHWSPS